MDGWIDGLIPTTCYHEWDWLLVHVYFERRFSFDMHMPFSTCFGIERCSFHTTCEFQVWFCSRCQVPDVTDYMFD